MNFTKIFAACGAAVMLLSAGPSSAATLPAAGFQTLPDITSTLSEIDYDAGTGAFSVTGFSVSLNPGGGDPVEFLLGDFNLTVDNLQVTYGGAPDPSFSFDSGSLTITNIAANTVLASSTLFAMGIDSGVSSGQLQLLFGELSGTAAALYNAQAPAALALLNSDIFNSASEIFRDSFNVTGTLAGTSDVAAVPLPAVPLPASGLLLLSVFGALAWIRRRREAAIAVCSSPSDTSHRLKPRRPTTSR